MIDFKKIMVPILLITLGMVIHSIYSELVKPLSDKSLLNLPTSRINESDIKVYNSHIVINISNLSWSSFYDTGSMKPVFGYGHNGIEMEVNNATKLYIGDIVAYRSNIVKDALIVHRIINIEFDEYGPLYTMKGDNNYNSDPEKIRKEQIVGVMVGIIY